MSTHDAQDETPTDRRFLTLGLAAIRIVYGDIGTIPIAIRESFYESYESRRLSRTSWGCCRSSSGA